MMTKRVYAVGDIHGHLSRLVDIHARIARDRAQVGDTTAPVVHVGDLVDRGPDSKGVIDHLLLGLERGENWIVLKGNHDRLFQKFLDDPDWRDPVLRPDYTWRHANMGGWTTLNSYGIDTDTALALPALHAQALAHVPTAHRDFLAGLPLYHEAGKALFVHAGIRPGVGLQNQTEDDLIWIRRDFHDHIDPLDHLVIHGHTVIDAVTHYGNRINIDTGAAYGHELSAIVIENGQTWVLDPDGRRPLPNPAIRPPPQAR